MRQLRLLVLLCALGAALTAAGSASASQLVARNASHIKLGVNAKGTAMVTYSVRGQVTHLLAWGAVNARQRPASPKIKQVEFKLDYSGGWKHHRLTWKTFKNTCGAYDGPDLPWLVTACKASNGSYWALQSWQTALPDLGLAPWLGQQKTWWLHLSHWTGDIGEARRLHGLDLRRPLPGGLRPVHLPGQGHPRLRHDEAWARRPTATAGCSSSTRTTRPTGRAGCARTRSSRTGRPGCSATASMPGTRGSAAMRIPRSTPNRKRGPGTGEQYRITAPGPGVTPDVMWQGPGLHPYDKHNPADASLESAMNAERDQIRAGYGKCSHT